MNYRKTKTLFKGYSLVETIVGIWLFSMILLSLTGIFLYNYAIASFSENFVKASHIAQSLMYDLKINDYDTLESRIGSNTYAISSEAISYTVSETIARKSNDSKSEDYGILMLNVRIDWLDSTKAELTDKKNVDRMSQRLHSITLESVVSSITQY
jgi:hypothetical protein